MKPFILAMTVITPCAAVSQPYSASMTDCASLYQNMAQIVPSDQDAYRMMYAANQWAEAAVVQAKTEGRATTHEATWQEIDSKTEDWQAKGKMFFFSEEFRDWAAYCRKFAKHTGVAIEP